MVKPEALQKYSLFGGLLEEQIQTIIPLMQVEKYSPGELIITEGNTNDKIFFILEGQVEVSRGNVTLSNFGEGEAFGEMEMLDVMPAVASIKAISQVTVMSITHKALHEIYKLDVKIFSLIIMNLARDLCRRLRKSDEKLSSSNILL